MIKRDIILADGFPTATADGYTSAVDQRGAIPEHVTGTRGASGATTTAHSLRGEAVDVVVESENVKVICRVCHLAS